MTPWEAYDASFNNFDTSRSDYDESYTQNSFEIDLNSVHTATPSDGFQFSENQSLSENSDLNLIGFSDTTQAFKDAQHEAVSATSIFNLSYQLEVPNSNLEILEGSGAARSQDLIVTDHFICSVISETIVTGLAQSPPGMFTTIAEMGGPVAVPMGLLLDGAANFLRNSEAAQGVAKSSLESLCNNIASKLDDEQSRREAFGARPTIGRRL